MALLPSSADTIFAPATAPGRAGIAVIRLTGAQAGPIVESLTGQLPPPRMATLCSLRHGGEVLDKALVLWFVAPASYTGENMAELHVHGGRAVLQAVTQALLELGARMAEPGEFTRRAVMHGKLDLTEAEAVADLVDAETSLQRRQALGQLGGRLRDLYSGWQNELTRLLAYLEATIDFAEDDLPADLHDRLTGEIQALLGQIRIHLADGRRGERLRDGIYVAIIGAPNAGKSSLLNRLAARDVAIVTSIPGTTRDVLEVACDIEGYPVTFADTAGLRETSDVVEAEGVKRAKARAVSADLKLLVFDATTPLPPDTPTWAQIDANSLVLLNKCDVAPDTELHKKLQHACPPGVPLLPLSANTGEGFAELLQAVASRAEQLAGYRETPTLSRARHRAALEECAQSLERACFAATEDLRAEDVRLASRALGRIMGQVGVEDLLDVIFRDFCIGK